MSLVFKVVVLRALSPNSWWFLLHKVILGSKNNYYRKETKLWCVKECGIHKLSYMLLIWNQIKVKKENKI